MINPIRVIDEPCVRTFGQFLPLTQHNKFEQRQSRMHGYIEGAKYSDLCRRIKEDDRILWN